MNGWISEPLMTNKLRHASEEPGTPKKKFQFNINWKWKWKSMPSMNQWHRYSQHKGFNGPCHSGEQPFNHSSIVGQPNDGCDQQQFRISIIISGHILSISTKWVFSKKVMHVWPDFLQEISWQWLYPWPGRAGHMDSSHPIILWRNMRMLHVFCFSFNSVLIIYYQLISNKLDVILWLPTPPASSSSSHHHMAKCITPPVAVVVVV